MNSSTSDRVSATLLAAAAALAIAGFTALGSLFDYPAILKSPTAEILRDFRAHETAVAGWFAVLTVGAALLAPIGVLLGRRTGGRLGRWIAVLGVAGAVVQAVGLSRWFLFVPSLSGRAADPAHAADARHTFELLHRWLGTVIGETIGYALTAAFTALVVVAIARGGGPRWLSWLGVGSAALIATGILVPLGVDAAALTNFVGYVAWCIWVLALAAILGRAEPIAPRVTSAALRSR